MLEGYIINHDILSDVKLIISNNCSTDNTRQIIENFKNKTTINLDIYHQEENHGLEKNALFVLKKATSEYVMYLGDDDYISEDYLINSVKIIKNNSKITCIIPSIQPISQDGELKKSGRDMHLDSKLYNKGFTNCLKNSWRGHQLSGLLLKRVNMLESYIINHVNNIYPFIYFVGYNCLRGKTLHFTDYPVEVTVTCQNNKDWGYGKDGLVSDIFDNYKKMPNINLIQRSKLELKLLDRQSSRYQMYLSKGFISFATAIIKIIFGKNTSYISKLFFPILLTKKIIKKVFIKILKIVLGNKYKKIRNKVKENLGI
jgi:glycosyltransferase involved in cell wall biosynthesis